jgi:HPt (histidine-containing phosphotransfer) domain-containing protein
MENSSTPANTNVVDFARLKELFGDDDATIHKLLDTFVTTTPPLLAQLKSAVASANFIEIKSLGHQLAGSAVNLGAQRLHLLARELEHAAGECSSAQCHTLFNAIMTAFVEVSDVVSTIR